MADGLKTALVLCTGNSARSIMGEALINHLGRGRWHAVSAGSHPTGRINPFALQALADAGIPPPPALRSKHWREYALPNGIPIDLVITVCTNAANEVCPFFPGSPRTVHLPFPDPATIEGSDEIKLIGFRKVLSDMHRKLQLLLA